MSMLARLQQRFDEAVSRTSRMPSTSTDSENNIVDRFRLFQSSDRTPGHGSRRARRNRERPGRVHRTFTRQVTLLPSPAVRSIANFVRLQDDGLKKKRICFDLNSSREQFYNKLREEFPSLANITFRLCKVGPSKEVVRLDEVLCTPMQLRNHQQHRRSNLYILPSEELPRNETNQETDEEMVVAFECDEEREVEQLQQVVEQTGDEEQPRATRNDQPGPVIRVEGRDSPTHDVDDLPAVFEEQPRLVHIPAGTPTVSFGIPVNETLDVTRAIRRATDEAFEESLRVDRLRERETAQRLARDADLERQRRERERRREEVIRARIEQWEQRVPPNEGISVKFRYPDGSREACLFRGTETVQDLFTAAGRNDNATVTFDIRVASTGLSLESFMPNALDSMDLHQSILQVSWSDDDEEPVQSGNLAADDGNSSDKSADDSESDVSLKELILELSRQIDTDLPSNIINVYRANVLDGGMRGFRKKRFNPKSQLNVSFAGECGIDNKGLTREFLTLALAEIKNSPLLAGEREKNLILDYAHMDKYETAGAIMAFSIVHRGPLPTFFSPLAFKLLSGQEVQGTIDDVMDSEVRDIINKIKESDDEELLTTHFEFISQSGCVNLMNKKDQLIKSLVQFHAIDRHREACDRLRKGLQTLGVLDSVLSHPATWEKGFIHQDLKLTKETVEDLFMVNFSPIGSNRRPAEEQCHAYWRDFLDELEEEDLLERLLLFATGMEQIPTVGFVKKPEIIFRHRDSIAISNIITAEFPIANTCALQLALPILSSYSLFAERMMATIKSPIVFSLA